MTTTFREIMDLTGLVLDAGGVLVVVAGVLVSVVRFIAGRAASFADSYRALRTEVGRAILLGLEFLIAGDIINSVVVDPTVTNIATLGMIVLIRTFLSMTLQLEVEGRWPWQRVEANPSVSKPARVSR